MSLPSFLWLSASACPPARWDLRYADWNIVFPEHRKDAPDPLPALLDWRPASRLEVWDGIVEPETIVAVGVDDPEERARLIAGGLGDAVGTQIVLVELAARLLRLEICAGKLPRNRAIGPIELDLFYRDARDGKGWIGLHPREFALLWRLSETPGRRVSRRELVRDVWRLDHLPETNSLEVHVSRLRAKLAISRCAWLVRTHSDGGSFLAYEAPVDIPPQADTLDRQVAIGNGVLADP